MQTNSESERFCIRIEPHLDALFRAAYRLTGNRTDAEDLVQETCTRAFTRSKAFAESRSPICWLMRVQHNLFIDGARQRQRSPTTSLEHDFEANLPAGESSNPERCTYETQREAQLLHALSQLTHDQRALLTLRVEGYSLAEMQEITGLAVDVLNARLHRARQSLTRHMKPEIGTVEPPIRMEGRR